MGNGRQRPDRRSQVGCTSQDSSFEKPVQLWGPSMNGTGNHAQQMCWLLTSLFPQSIWLTSVILTKRYLDFAHFTGEIPLDLCNYAREGIVF